MVAAVIMSVTSRSSAKATQRRQRECMRRVVRQIEPALQCQMRMGRVTEAGFSGSAQAVELGGDHRLPTESPHADEVLQLMRGHRPCRGP
jgi:hypothetical protein